ncbi:hypothetical protein MMC28_011615 [Mycoblastus sanguinarius]|nr:hypothetical protein [Mycoblastus sanguinarius]
MDLGLEIPKRIDWDPFFLPYCELNDAHTQTNGLFFNITHETNSLSTMGSTVSNTSHSHRSIGASNDAITKYKFPYQVDWPECSQWWSTTGNPVVDSTLTLPITSGSPIHGDGVVTRDAQQEIASFFTRVEEKIKLSIDRDFPKPTSNNSKLWVCVDASIDGSFLSKCKSCNSERRYTSLRGAAAHLRSVHFGALRQSHGSKPKGGVSRGKGGRANPIPINALRRWTKEIENNLQSD